MDIRNCKMCDRLFQSNGRVYCPECIREIDEMFVVVREYIYENDDASISEVADATGVDERLIFDFLREGRLELKKASMTLPCERCGRAIRTGMYCDNCAEEVEKEFKAAFSTNKKSNDNKFKNSGEKMYVANRRLR